MSGNSKGGKLTAIVNKAKYGEDYYKRIGAKGGKVKNPKKGFGTRREIASELGKLGAPKSHESRRRKLYE